MKVLFLDDNKNRRAIFERTFSQGITVETAKTAKECIDKIYHGWDVVFLDHDLGGEEYVDSSVKNCGMEVVRHLEEISAFTEPMVPLPEIDKIIVHSLNDPAAENMAERLSRLGYNVERIPFTTLKYFWNQ